MFKRILMLIFVLIVTAQIWTLTLADLNLDDQDSIKELLISEDEDITELNVESLEGIEYTLIFETDEYVVIVVDGKFVIYYR